jgi:hypothetical protein
MKVVEPGHIYELAHLESKGTERLTFIRRSSKAIQHPSEHPGTNVQETLRALIDRTKYLDDIIGAVENDDALYHLRMALLCYEGRAYRRKMDKLNGESAEHTSFRERDADLPFTEMGFRDGPDVGIENLLTGLDGHIHCPK